MRVLQTMLAKVSELRASLREHWRKYAAVFIAAALAVSCAIRSGSRALHKNELQAQSMLRLAAGDVHFHTQENGLGSRRSGRAGDRLPRMRDSEERNCDAGRSYVPPESTVVITPKDRTKRLEDVVDISYRGKFGFTAEPGIDIPLGPMGIGLDLKWFYIYKVGIEAGGVKLFAPIDALSPTLGLSYRLDAYRLLKNTELKLSYIPLSPIPASLGIRVNF